MENLYIVSWNGLSDVGGVERVTQYLKQAWEERYHVEIIDYLRLEEKKTYQYFVHKCYVIDAMLFSRYMRKIQQNDPEAKVVVQGFNCPFVKSDLMFLHGTMRGFKVATRTKFAEWRFNQIFEKISLKNAKQVVAVSENAKEEAIRYYHADAKKIRVINNCVDGETFYPIKRKKSEECTIIFCGRLETAKGIDELLKLAERIDNEKDFRLLIATNTTMNVDKFAGFKHTEIVVGLKKHEMNDFYNRGDVMLFPSRYEGFEMVTAECLSAGVPVMGHMVGAVRDLYNSHFDGIDIMSDDMDVVLEELHKMKEQYSSMEQRQLLHNRIIARCGEERYVVSLQELM